MTTLALLMLLLVNGDAKAEIMSVEDCKAIVESMRSGSRVTVVDHDGKEHEVEMAKCIVNFQTLMEKEPVS